MKKVNWQTQTWGKTGEKRWRKWKQLTFADCFFGKQSRSKFGFDLTQGIPNLVVFLTFDAICHQTHFIDGIHVSFFLKEFSSIWAFYSGVCCKSQWWTRAVHKRKNIKKTCYRDTFSFWTCWHFIKPQGFILYYTCIYIAEICFSVGPPIS